jgi:hypothetical protein
MSKLFNKIVCLVSTAIFFASCTSVKMHMSVPEKFQEQAEKLPIAGIVNNGAGRKPLSFGSYMTSKIKRGWNVTTGRPDRNTRATTEERLMRAFNIGTMNTTSTQKDRFSFTITDGNLAAEIFGLERRTKEETRFKNLRNGSFSDYNNNSIEKNFQYSFSAIIDVQSIANTSTWNLILYSSYDHTKKKKIFEAEDIKEEGILTHEKDTITIKAIKIQTFITDKGEERSLPFPIPSAYELRNEDGVCAIIDTWGKIVWMYRELDNPSKLAIAAAASAILLRRVTSSGT